MSPGYAVLLFHSKRREYSFVHFYTFLQCAERAAALPALRTRQRHNLLARIMPRYLISLLTLIFEYCDAPTEENAWTSNSKVSARWSPAARRVSGLPSPQAWPGKVRASLSPAAVTKAVADVRTATGGDVVGFAGDFGAAAAAEEVVRRYSDVEILVNNLGIFEPKPFEQISDSDWMRFFEVNVLSGVRLARLCLPAMRRADWGRIIFISSESALQIPVEMIHYGVTKTAQIALARGLAEVVAGTGITVNSVLPGPTKSRGVVDFVGALTQGKATSFEEFETEFFEKVRPTSLIKRFASPEEVASRVTYLASPLASATTGATLRVDGGVIKSAF